MIQLQHAGQRRDRVLVGSDRDDLYEARLEIETWINRRGATSALRLQLIADGRPVREWAVVDDGPEPPPRRRLA